MEQDGGGKTISIDFDPTSRLVSSLKEEIQKVTKISLINQSLYFTNPKVELNGSSVLSNYGIKSGSTVTLHFNLKISITLVDKNNIEPKNYELVNPSDLIKSLIEKSIKLQNLKSPRLTFSEPGILPVQEGLVLDHLRTFKSYDFPIKSVVKYFDTDRGSSPMDTSKKKSSSPSPSSASNNSRYFRRENSNLRTLVLKL